MEVDVLLKNGKIVTQGKIVDGFVAVQGEKIVAVGNSNNGTTLARYLAN